MKAYERCLTNGQHKISAGRSKKRQHPPKHNVFNQAKKQQHNTQSFGWRNKRTSQDWLFSIKLKKKKDRKHCFRPSKQNAKKDSRYARKNNVNKQTKQQHKLHCLQSSKKKQQDKYTVHTQTSHYMCKIHPTNFKPIWNALVAKLWNPINHLLLLAPKSVLIS